MPKRIPGVLPEQKGLASIEDRTRDLLLTRQMLCQLSYRGHFAPLEASFVTRNGPQDPQKPPPADIMLFTAIDALLAQLNSASDF